MLAGLVVASALSWGLLASPQAFLRHASGITSRRCRHGSAPRVQLADDDEQASPAIPPSVADNPLGPLPPVGETLRTLTPECIRIEALDLSAPMDDLFAPIDPSATFVDLFRSCTPYIKMHQGSAMVIHIASEALEKVELFDALMQEVAMLALLGVRPVLLVGVHRQVDESLRARGLPQPLFSNGMRATDEPTMRIVQEVCGFMRSRVEGALSRGRARSGPGGSVGVDVVGGNFFYTAQPIGVRNGIDYGFSGEVRSVDVEKISQHLDAGEIVLLSSLGYSASGTIFNVRSEQVAASVSAALGATKLLFLTSQRLMEVGCGPSHASSVLQSMRLAEAKAFLKHAHPGRAATAGTAQQQPPPPLPPPQQQGQQQPSPQPQQPQAQQPPTPVPVSTPSPLAASNATSPMGVGAAEMQPAPTMAVADPDGEASILDLCAHCIHALEKGVLRGHILPPIPGALVQELYTTDGIGTLISRDVYDGIRLATAADVPNIIDLIEPLEARGILIRRPPEVLARDVHSGFYYVYTRDDTLLACAQLKRYSSTHAEIGCLVVASQYRRQGCGDAMLGFLERTAAAAGVEKLFALSTHTMQWFLERGFSACPLTALPERRVAIYNHERGSKIYMKPLSSSRQIDAEELFWMEAMSKTQPSIRGRR